VPTEKAVTVSLYVIVFHTYRAAVKDLSKITQIDDWSQKLPRRGRDEVKRAQNTLVRPTIRPTTLSVEQQIPTELSPIDRFGDER
jgi:hypothetical protein